MISTVLRNGKYRSRIISLIRYKSKYSNIDEFNKNKTKYNFGYNFDSINELDEKINPEKFKQRMMNQNEEIVNINEIIEADPSLKQFKVGSPEYKLQMDKLHREYVINAQKEQRKEQIKEGFRGLFIAVATIIAILTAHQVFMNYGSIKNRLFANYNYKDFKDTTKKLSNTKNKQYRLEKLNAELSDENLNNLKGSKENTGIYYFGGDCKLPIRIPEFNDMVFKDVYVEKDLIVAITDKGKVYKWKKQHGIKHIEIPYKIEKVTPTETHFYFQTNKGEILYVPRNEFGESSIRSWFYKTQKFSKVENVKNIQQMSSGRNHVLVLDNQGKILILNSSSRGKNRGQYGPTYSPFENKTIPLNEPIDITLLNNEIKNDRVGTKIVESRKFEHIACGDYFNIASDIFGNVWTWGDNSFGQCGEVNTVDLKPIPKPVFNKRDLARICRNVTKATSLTIKQVLASHDTSYLLLNFNDEQDVILSFGNGIEGQLGGGVYKQISCWPEIMKSLVNLKEFNEEENKVTNISVKDLSAGKNHLFVTLDNAGVNKDVLVCGSNEYGQFGNGKKIKSSKPIQIPQLLEPQNTNKSQIITNLNDTNNKRLALSDNQRVVAGKDASVIYYCK